MYIKLTFNIFLQKMKILIGETMILAHKAKGPVFNSVDIPAGMNIGFFFIFLLLNPMVGRV